MGRSVLQFPSFLVSQSPSFPFHLQRFQAAEVEGGAVVGGGAREAEVREAAEEGGEGDLALQAREGGAEAEVGAVAEGDVAALGAADDEAVGVRELFRVA